MVWYHRTIILSQGVVDIVGPLDNHIVTRCGGYCRTTGQSYGVVDSVGP